MFRKTTSKVGELEFYVMALALQSPALALLYIRALLERLKWLFSSISRHGCASRQDLGCTRQSCCVRSGGQTWHHSRNHGTTAPWHQEQRSLAPAGDTASPGFSSCHNLHFRLRLRTTVSMGLILCLKKRKLRLGGIFAVLEAGDVTPAKETCFADTFFSPWEILAFHSCKRIQLFSRCRPQESLVLVIGWSLMEGKATAWISAAVAVFPASE